MDMNIIEQITETRNGSFKKLHNTGSTTLHLYSIRVPWSWKQAFWLCNRFYYHKKLISQEFLSSAIWNKPRGQRGTL